MKLKFTPRAKADLGEIFAYVAQDNPSCRTDYNQNP